MLEDVALLKSLFAGLYEKCRNVVEELISIVLTSGDLSFRLTMNGFDIHRFVYDDMEEETKRRAQMRREQRAELRAKRNARKGRS